MAIIGIDLGTTYSVSASMEDGRVIVISNVEGKQTTPSVVFFQDDMLDRVLVGDSAMFSAGTDPERAVRAIKRHMGTNFVKKIGEAGFTPEQISSKILEKLKADAEQSLNEPVTHAVITVPAYFEGAEREATKQAAKLAGLQVLALLNEPVAAAIDFAQTRGEELANKTVLVYDLGGGTFDVTVMRVTRKGGPGSPLAFDIVGKDGSRELGGLDWDRALARHVSEEFAQAHPGKNPADDPVSFDQLLLHCQQAKESLSFKEEDGTVTILVTHDGVQHPVTVSRRKFEEITFDLLTQTFDKASQLIAGLHGKGITWSSIDYILLAGGSTKMPAVSRTLESISGKKPVTNKGVDFNVGRGAAYLAFSPDAWTCSDGLSDVVIEETRRDGPKRGGIEKPPSDQATHSVGISVWDATKRKDYNHILIQKGSKLGTRSKEETFQTIDDNQECVDIVIIDGESEDIEQTRELGKVRIGPLPPLPSGQPIRVWLSYNADGLITGQAVHVPTGKNAEINVSLNRREL
ncbi:MAG: Hsp70 family protein [Gemmataceae bacterium]